MALTEEEKKRIKEEELLGQRLAAKFRARKKQAGRYI